MARIFIDCHMLSEDWFKDVLPELISTKSVAFVYGGSEKLITEMSAVRKALELYKIVGNLKNSSQQSRRIDVSDTI